MPRFIDGHWDGRIRLMRRDQVSTGLFLERLPLLQKQFEVILKDCRDSLRFKKPPAEVWKASHRFQQECYLAMVEGSKTGGLVLNATGSGKTRIAGLFFSALIGRGLFVVDELSLLVQAREAIQQIIGEEVGIMGGGQEAIRRITIATCQTLIRRLDQLGGGSLPTDVVILDEVHEAINRRSTEILAVLKPKAVFGLTATLRLRRPSILLPVTALTGPVLYRYPAEQGIREGMLAQGLVIRIPYGSAMRSRWADGFQRYEEFIVHEEARHELVAAYAEESVRHGRPTIVLVDRIEHLDALSEKVKVPHQVLCGRDSKEKRRQAIREMTEEKLPLILTNRVFGKGVDIPNLQTTIDATGLKSKNTAQQRLGRGLRRSIGKIGLLHIDIADRGFVSTRERLTAYLELGLKVITLHNPELTPTSVLEKAEAILSKIYRKEKPDIENENKKQASLFEDRQ